MKTVLTPAVRAWIYGLVLASVPLLVFYGLVDAKAAPLFLTLAVALLNIDTTPKGKHEA